MHYEVKFSYFQLTSTIAHTIFEYPLEEPAVSILYRTYTMVRAVLEFSEIG